MLLHRLYSQLQGSFFIILILFPQLSCDLFHLHLVMYNYTAQHAKKVVSDSLQGLEDFAIC